jgi:hypothetical protein
MGDRKPNLQQRGSVPPQFLKKSSKTAVFTLSNSQDPHVECTSSYIKYSNYFTFATLPIK